MTLRTRYNDGNDTRSLMTGSSTVTFTIVPVSNHPPTNIVLSTTNVLENQPSGTTVGGLRTQDPDTGNTFTYTLVPGAGDTNNSSFMISGTNLQTAASFNYEVKNSYSVRIRTTDQGALSFEKVFTVLVTDVAEPPAMPSNVFPTNAAVNQSVTPTLQASAFSDPDSGDTHAASQWQVLSGAGAVVVADSGTDIVNKVSWTVPNGKLDYGSNYQWRVRYSDSRNLWSSNSTQTAFTTIGPSLGGSRQGLNIVFKWPTNAPGFALQRSTNLGVVNWSNATPVPVIVNGQYTVTNSMTNKSSFYRLQK